MTYVSETAGRRLSYLQGRFDANAVSWKYAAWGVGIVFFLAMTTLCLFRYWNIWATAFDLGIETQVIWNTANMRWFESSLEVQNYLGDHTTFITLFFAAVYRILPWTETILVLQVLVYTLAAVPCYRIARRILGAECWGFLAAAVFLWQPAGAWGLSYDFHTLAACSLFGLLAVDCMLCRKWVWAWISFVLLLMIREDCGLTAMAMGILVWAMGYRKSGAVMGIVGLCWFVLMLFVVLPYFRSGASDTLGRYSHFGTSGGEIVRTIILSPPTLIHHLLDDPRRLAYPIVLTLPWLFMPLLSLRGIIALGIIIAPGVLSSIYTQYTIGWQYPLMMFPVIALAGILGTKNMMRWKPQLKVFRYPAYGAAGVLVALALMVLTHSVFVYGAYFFPHNPLREEVAEVRPCVPDDASLSATQKMLPLFVKRRCLASYPELTWPAQRYPKLPSRQADYVLIYTEDEGVRVNGRTDIPAGYEPVIRTRHLRLFRRRPDDAKQD